MYSVYVPHTTALSMDWLISSSPQLYVVSTQYPHFTDKESKKQELWIVAHLASVRTEKVKDWHILLLERLLGLRTQPVIMTKSQSLREQTLNLSFLRRPWSNQGEQATEKHAEQLGKKAKSKLRNKEGCLFGLGFVFF